MKVEALLVAVSLFAENYVIEKNSQNEFYEPF